MSGSFWFWVGVLNRAHSPLLFTLRPSSIIINNLSSYGLDTSSKSPPPSWFFFSNKIKIKWSWGGGGEAGWSVTNDCKNSKQRNRQLGWRNPRSMDDIKGFWPYAFVPGGAIKRAEVTLARTWTVCVTFSRLAQRRSKTKKNIFILPESFCTRAKLFVRCFLEMKKSGES